MSKAPKIIPDNHPRLDGSTYLRRADAYLSRKSPKKNELTDLTEAQQKRKESVEWMKQYMVTYDQQVGYLNYDNDMICNDVLYMLGVAINKDKYSYADGFELFKQELSKKLMVECGNNVFKGQKYDL